MKRILSRCLVVVALFASIPALAQPAGRQLLHGHVPAAVARLSPTGRLAASTRLNLAIGLPLRNTEALDKLLQELYDPASPQYRHFLTPEQFTEDFGPSEKDYQAVMEFAKTNGLTVTGAYLNRVLVNVSGSVSDIEKALHVNLRVFRHPTKNRAFFAPDTEPSLDLQAAVADISGLDNFELPHPNLKAMPLGQAASPASQNGSQPSGFYWGYDFRNAYAPGVSLTGSGQIVGLLEFDGYYGIDITDYENQTGLANVPLQNIVLDGVSGAPGYSGNANGVSEVSLDIEMAIAMAPGLSKVIVYEGGLPNSILNSMATNVAVKQFSASWTWSGGPTTTTDDIFKTLAAQGQSFFQASGDSDAYGNTIDQWSSVTVPVDSTNITSVGATTLTMNGNGESWSSEAVWNAGGGVGSSGGVSTYYSIPSWQQGIDMTANLGSTSQRNIPDVAMVGNQIWVIYGNGQSGPFGGTSCAAPLWAGFTALANQLAAANDRPAVGLINQAVYAIGKGPGYGSDFHDVTSGNNYRSGSPTKYPATAGYDLCTGWGTPNGLQLILALASPDALGIVPGTGFDAVGAYGGPFSPGSQGFSLTNSGAASLTWSLVNIPLWLNVSAAGGTLASGSGTSVTVSLGTAAATLAPGVYSADPEFFNLISGFTQFRPVTLTVSPLELVQNGGFESGDFSHWTLSGDTSFTTVIGEVPLGPGTNIFPHSGSFEALLGTSGSLGFVSQTLSTSPGQAYLISLWLNSPDGMRPNEFRVSWNGTTLSDQVNMPAFPGDHWTNLQFIVAATGASTVLRLGFQNDYSYLAIDDVSVQPVPAPPFQTVTAGAGTVSFAWNAMVGLSYQVQYTTNLAQPIWIDLGAPITATNNTPSASDTTGPDPQRFYRLSVSP